MNTLPIPRRYVVDKFLYNSLCFYIHADAEIFTFLSLLAPVTEVDVFKNGRQARVALDPRYAFDKVSASSTYIWVNEELQKEFGSTPIPVKPQEE